MCLAGVGNPGTHGDPQSGQVPKEGSSIGVSGGAWCQNQKCTEASAPGVPGACGHQQHGELAVRGGQLRWSSLPKAVCHRVTRSRGVFVLDGGGRRRRDMATHSRRCRSHTGTITIMVRAMHPAHRCGRSSTIRCFIGHDGPGPGRLRCGRRPRRGESGGGGSRNRPEEGPPPAP